MLSKEFSNCHVTINEKGILTATIDLNKNVGKSASGKSFNMGTTNGNTKIPYQDKILNLGVNCYVKNPDYVVTEADKKKYREIFSK